MNQRGHILIETVMAATMLIIVAAIILPKTFYIYRTAQIEQEAATLVADLRNLQSQSRSSDFRAAGLNDFYAPSSVMTMYVNKSGWQIRHSVSEIYYRHNLPAALSIETFRSPAKVVVNFGQNGGSVQNNTFKIYAADNPSLCRYVIISGMGRIRTSTTPPAGEY